MSESKRIAVIMAGGSGERFWPLSRRLRPKQLLNLTRPDLNLLEESVARLATRIPVENIFIATARHLVDPIRTGNVGVPPENILGEPCKRNTAGCLAYVAAQILARYGDAANGVTMGVVTADHRIPNYEHFMQHVEAALEAAEHEPVIAVLGMQPTRPETGYGYIEVDETGMAGYDSPDGIAVFPVVRFLEKPDTETARTFQASGRHFWNGGMFFWKLKTFLDELVEASPAHAAAITQMATHIKAGHDAETDRVFESLDDISIDYALMEKARRVVAVRATFEWDDIGAWDSLDRSHEHDANGNVSLGDPILANSRNCIVYNEPGAAKMAVAVVGAEDLAVIVSDDAVLVIPKNLAQDVRKAVQALRERGASQL